MMFYLHIQNGYQSLEWFQDHCCKYKRPLVKVLLIVIFNLQDIKWFKGEFGIVYRGLLTPDSDTINGAPLSVAVKTLKGQYYH